MGERPSRSLEVAAAAASALTFTAVLFSLYRLLPELFGFFYTRLQPDNVLQHRGRAFLADYVRSNPGSSLADVVRATGVSRSVLRYHVAVLAHASALKRVRWNGNQLLLPAHAGAAPPESLIVQKDERLKFLRDIVQGGPVRQADLVRRVCDRFQVGDRTARKWAAKAVRLGIFAQSGRHKGAVFSALTPMESPGPPG